MCLAYCGQSKLPSSEAERDELFEAGLGEKDIEFEDVEVSPVSSGVQGDTSQLFPAMLGFQELDTLARRNRHGL